jgi:hypothetical protein
MRITQLLASNLFATALPVDAADEQEQLRRMVQRLLDKSGSELWEEDA